MTSSQEVVSRVQCVKLILRFTIATQQMLGLKCISPVCYLSRPYYSLQLATLQQGEDLITVMRLIFKQSFILMNNEVY